MTARRARTLAALGVLALVWGTQYLVVRFAEAELPPWRAVALRFGVVGILGQLAVIIEGAAAPRGTLGLRIAMGATQALSMGLLYEGQARLPSGLVSVLMSTTPLFVVVMARAWLSEPTTGRSVLASLLGLLGVGALSQAGWDERVGAVGVGLVVAAALASAVSKSVGKAVATLPISVLLRDLGWVVALLAVAASLALERDEAWNLSAVGLAGALYLGAVASTAANVLYFIVLRDMEVSRISYLQVVSASVGLAAGVVVAGERFTLATLGAAAVVLAGAAVHAFGAGRGGNESPARRRCSPPDSPSVVGEQIVSSGRVASTSDGQAGAADGAAASRIGRPQ